MDEDCSQSIEVTVEAAGWNVTVTDPEAFCADIARAALLELPDDVRERVELGIILTDDASIRELNARWRGKDKPTNVLSFPGVGDDEDWPPAGPVLLGDIVVAWETVRDEAEAAGIGADAHLAHMIVHGLLHLAGHDHIEDAEADEMEGAERRILGQLGFADPYAGTALLETSEEPLS